MKTCSQKLERLSIRHGFANRAKTHTNFNLIDLNEKIF